jgi:iron complex outermembrane receptor protein
MKKTVFALLGSAASFALMTGFALAQDADDEIVVTGTRVEGKSPTETLSPVDVHPGDDIAQQASFDLTDALTNIAPSINTQRFPIADGTAFIRPVNLRNLAPDQTLVLVNGVRRHRSALVNLQVEPFGTVNQGAQAVDFGLIPAIAIQRLEVLRDGASAQYGSDAIAGVINVILREDVGLELTAQYGQYYEGDGENFRIGGNGGLALGDRGFFNVSAEYVNSQITSRGSARPDAAAVAAAVGAANVPFNGLGQRWGDPDVEGYRLFVNTAYELSDNFEWYAHGSYASQDVVSGFFYRAPFGVAGVTPRGTLCVCTGGVPDPTPQSIVDAINMAGLDPNDYLTADAGSPSGFVSLNPIWTMFPGGYNPTFGAEIRDYSAVSGFRGGDDSFRWNLSARVERNRISYTLDNSINPGLGRLSPTSFRPGDLAQREAGVNLDFVVPVELGFVAPVNFAFGAEWRREVYEIFAGDPDSFAFGPTGILFGVGSDGFQGDSPAAAGVFKQRNYAGYVDLEGQINDWLTLGAAGRYETYNTFGDTFDWKVSGRIDATDWLAIRATVNTGFRAPTPGQINTLDVTTTADSMGNLVPLGTFPVDSVVAQTLGAQPVGPEESFNVTGGLILTLSDNFSVTADFYNIEVEDRIALVTQTITPGSPEDMALIAAGFPGLGSASFFQNAYDSRVRGIEVAAVLDVPAGAGGFTFDLRHSWNDQTVERVISGSLDPERIHDLENQLPDHRTILTTKYDSGGWFGALVRVNRYDDWEDFTFGELSTFGAEWLVDFEVSATIQENFRLAAGAENIFDNYPDAEQNGVLSFLGATRPVSSPFGFNGGFWYVRATANF